MLNNERYADSQTILRRYRRLTAFVLIAGAVATTGALFVDDPFSYGFALAAGMALPLLGLELAKANLRKGAHPQENRLKRILIQLLAAAVLGATAIIIGNFRS